MRWSWLIGIAAIGGGLLWLDAGSLPGALIRLRSILGELSGTLLVLGTAALVRAAWLWHRGRQAASWPIASGTVTRARVVSRKLRMGSTTYRQASKSTYYRPDLAYRYEVGGASFEGMRVRFGERTGWDKDHDKMARIVAPYTEGHAVQVRYDPARPQNAVLEAGPAPYLLTILLFAAVCLALSLAGWLR
ncbi:MAG TPA: DUF3592 domain-containing protein [Vicinamibacterales bacterium]|nr:DUF3592 domain-containing protein [Vicinamibacterales bacterium]